MRHCNPSLSAASLLAIAAFSAAPAGCARSDKPSIASQPYEGPQIRRSEAAGKHTLILTAPSGGWSFTVDQTRRTLEHTEVFVTAKRPNPAYMTTQALVDHEVTTGIATDQPITPFARVLDHNQDSGPYRPLP